MKSNLIELRIASLEGMQLVEEVDQVSLPTELGEITVMSNHEPLIAILKPGELLAKIGDKDIAYAVLGGVVEIKNNQVTVLADSAKSPDTVTEDEILKAQQLAEELKKKQGRFTDEEYQEFVYNIDKIIAQQKILDKFKQNKYRGFKPKS